MSDHLSSAAAQKAPVAEHAPGYLGPTSEQVSIRFFEGHTRTLSLLEVEAPPSWRGSERLRRALFLLRIQVVASDRERLGERVVHRLRIVEFDGAPIAATRRLQVQSSLISLLDLTLAPRRGHG